MISDIEHDFTQKSYEKYRPFPPDHIVDLEEAAMGWVLRLGIPREFFRNPHSTFAE